MTENYEKLVSEHWSEMATKNTIPYHWSDSEIVLEHINKCISGDPKIGWFQHACEKYLTKDTSKNKYGLSIGCGSGTLERQCRKMGFCDAMDGIDLAAGAIEEAKKLAKEEKITGINYQVQNIEKIDLPTNKYDVVFASSAIHHVKNLESLFEKIKTSLKPGCFFIMLEYVGPSQFQFSQKAVDIINEILAILPQFYKKLSSNPAKTKELFTIVSRDYMNANDPSEAIRSDEITPILSKYFTIVEKKDYGGTILHMLLQDIVSNFLDASYKDKTILRLLILFENILIKEKVLNSDFCFIVAKK